MVKKVTDYVQKLNMIENGDTVIAGVSGGADSVCLLSVLVELRKTMDITLIVAHVNHMFRETAVRDEEYVTALCAGMNLPCEVCRVDVQSVAKEWGMTFEEAGRKVRYEYFNQLKEQYKADKIAVAHNREDCSETMLFHLFRGSNLKGLGGMNPVNGSVIRPLMNVSRKEIEAYLRERNIEWMEDETNASVEYARNRIRHGILPEAEKICAGASVRIAETAEELRLAEEYLAKQTALAYNDCCELRDGGTFIQCSKLKEQHPFLRGRILYRALEQQAGASKDLGRIHVRELEKLCGLQAGRSMDLPYGLCAYRTSHGILVRKENKGRCLQKEVLPEDIQTAQECVRGGGVSVAIALLSKKDLENGAEIRFTLPNLGTVTAKLLFDYELENIPQKAYTKWFDYDKISSCAVFRKRIEGDYLVINDKGSHKTLKEYFIQEKIPAYKRDDVWILTDEDHVMWVPGYRISSYYKITEETERVLEISIGGQTDG